MLCMEPRTRVELGHHLLQPGICVAMLSITLTVHDLAEAQSHLQHSRSLSLSAPETEREVLEGLHVFVQSGINLKYK